MSVLRKIEFYVGFRLLVNDVFSVVFKSVLPEGSGPLLEVLQYQVNPCGSRSKLLHLPPVPKISLISMSPDGGRIRY